MKSSMAPWVGALVVGLVLGPAVWGAAPLVAQEENPPEGSLTIEAQTGFAFPAGDLRDVADMGVMAGGTIGYLFHENFGWRAGVEGIFLNDTRDIHGVVPSPAMNMVHLTTGPELVFPRPAFQMLPLTFRLFVAGGAAMVDATESFGDGTSVTFDQSYFVFNFGGAVGYQVTPEVNVFVDGRGYLFFFDEQDTAAFAERSQFVEPFSRGWVLPLTVGVRFAFQP